MQFIDKCEILLRAGNGGNGMIAWRREAHVEFGGPAGGDGGNGGNIYLLADHNETTLFNLRYIKEIKAEDGINGQSENKTGANGKDKIVKVPVGTVVLDQDKNIIIDLNKDKQIFLICHGGKGGLGNASFKSNSNRAPNLYERGEKGEEKYITLELKNIADIGLIGLPNAGKSTFIKTVCNVDVKIGNYPFTTIHPVLGTYFYKNKRIIFSDIPGLIEGASEGKGLGHEFLRHVERCKILIHMISGSEEDNESIIEAYETINNELNKYGKNLNKKKIFIVVSKADIESSKIQYEILQDYLKNQKVYLISCNTGENLIEFVNNVITDFLNSNVNSDVESLEINDSQITEFINENGIFTYNIDKFKKDKNKNLDNIDDENLKIYNDKNNFIHVKHPILEYWSNRIPHDTRDNIIRFNEKMENLNLNKILKKYNLKSDDTVIIDNYNIEWIID